MSEYTVVSLSGSTGGAPFKLDDSSSPGRLVHENPADSGGNDLLRDILIQNPNPNQISLFLQTQGPGIATPIVERIDVPPTSEGEDVRILRVPILLEPGYSFYIRTDLSTGVTEPVLQGHVERYPLAFEGGGHGGLNQEGSLILGDGTLDAGWDTYPWTAGSVTDPVNVVQDPANNRFQINRDGVWALSVVVSIEFTDSNSGRRTNIRLFNETKSVAVELAPLYAGRNQEGAPGVMAPIFDLDPAVIGDWFRVEIGGGDSFSGVTAEGGDLVLMRVADT